MPLQFQLSRMLAAYPESHNQCIYLTANVCKQPTAYFKFLALPAELRNQIYHLSLVAKAQPIIIKEFEMPRMDYLQSVRGHTRMYEEIDIRKVTLTHRGRVLNNAKLGLLTALLRVSKQIHEEAVAILYKFNDFRFCNWGTFHCFLSISGQDIKRYLRFITLPLPLPVGHENNEELLSMDDIQHWNYNVSWPMDAASTFNRLPSLRQIAVVVKCDVWNGQLDGHTDIAECQAFYQIPEHVKVKIQGEPIQYNPFYRKPQEGRLKRKPALYPSMATLYKERRWVVDPNGFQVESGEGKWATYRRY